MLASNYGRLGLVPGKSTWDLWWAECHWNMFFSMYFRLPCISPMVHHHILCTHNTCYIILATDVIIKQNVSLFCYPNTWENQSDTGTWTVEIWQHGLCLVITYSVCLGTAYFVCFFNIVNTGTLTEISNASISASLTARFHYHIKWSSFPCLWKWWLAIMLVQYVKKWYYYLWMRHHRTTSLLLQPESGVLQNKGT